MKRTLIDRAFLVVLGPDAPTDEAWSAFLDTLTAQGPGVVLLVAIERAVPTRLQRVALRAALRGRTLPIAVWSESAPARIRSRVASWTGGMWGPAFGSLADALAHLGLRAARAPFVRHHIARLRLAARVEDRIHALHADAQHCAACSSTEWGDCTCTCAVCTNARALMRQARRAVLGAPDGTREARAFVSGAPAMQVPPANEGDFDRLLDVIFRSRAGEANR